MVQTIISSLVSAHKQKINTQTLLCLYMLPLCFRSAPKISVMYISEHLHKHPYSFWSSNILSIFLHFFLTFHTFLYTKKWQNWLLWLHSHKKRTWNLPGYTMSKKPLSKAIYTNVARKMTKCIALVNFCCLSKISCFVITCEMTGVKIRMRSNEGCIHLDLSLQECFRLRNCPSLCQAAQLNVFGIFWKGP